ncbi:MAG: hypothetical protein PVH52_07430, partial [bacterium]
MSLWKTSAENGKAPVEIEAAHEVKARVDYGRILIIQTAFLGDVILITPLIRATREIFPGAAIDVLVTPQTAGILENNPHIR